MLYMVMPGRRDGQLHAEGGALADGAAHGDGAAHHIHDALDQAEAQADALLLAALVRLIEFVKNMPFGFF